MAPAKAFLFLSLLSIAVACNGSESQGLTADDLGAMVLTKEELGEKFEAVEHFLEESGPQPNEKFLSSFDDPIEGRRFIEEFSRVTGYDQVFQGPALVAQSLTLYQTAGGAEAATGSLLDRSNRGSPALEEFDAGRIGDQTYAAVVKDAAGLSLNILFRVDKLGALVSISLSQQSPLADETALQNDLRDLAEKLAAKIEAGSS